MKNLILPVIATAVTAAAVTNSAPSADDLQAQRFLAEADTILSIYPDDNNFGINRLPTMHGRQYFDNRIPLEKPCAEAWGSMENSNYLALKSWGQFDKNGVPQRDSVMSGHYQLNWSPITANDESSQNLKNYHNAEDRFHREIGPKAAAALYISGEKTSRLEFQYVKERAVLDLRAIYPSSKACLSCHQDVQSGKPIGVLGLLRLPKQK